MKLERDIDLIIKHLREILKTSDAQDYRMLSYILRMAEHEAMDLAANARPERREVVEED